MKTVIQRVSQASVTIDSEIVADIQKGLLVLVGIEDADSQEDRNWLCQKMHSYFAALIIITKSCQRFSLVGCEF